MGRPMQKPAVRVFTLSLGMLIATPALAADDNQQTKKDSPPPLPPNKQRLASRSLRATMKTISPSRPKLS
jgi:hypothetical protein